jgi:nitroreductase
MPNEVFEAVRTVLAIRQYADREVPEDVLRRAVEAAWLTASGGNRQPWHFVLVRERESLRRLGELVRTGPYIAQAPAAVVVAYERQAGGIGVSDASRAVQSMILTAWADGVGSNWTGFGSLDGVREYVGLPEQYDVLSVIPLGYPRAEVRGRKKRKALTEVASSERFGTPLE